MAPAFSISTDPALNLIQIEMSGFFDAQDILEFEKARNAAHRQLKCKPNQHLTLVDIRGMLIQSQAAVVGFKSILDNPSYASKGLAIVVSQTLARMQIQRAAVNRDVKYFIDDMVSAQQWLLSI